MADFEGATIDDIYKAFAKAETGSYDDPWIRTKGYGSSAYGPVQLTGGGGSDKAIRENKQSMMWNVYHDPKMAEKMGITEKDRIYISRFLEQADEFLAPVSDEDLSTYGYGGSGVLRTKEDKDMYETIAKKLFKYEYEVTSKGNIDEFLRRMRGPTKHFRGGKDVGHTTKFKGRLAELTAKRKKKSDIESLMPDEAIMDSVVKGVR